MPLSSAMFAACGMDDCGFESRTSINACGHICKYVDQKGLPAMLTSIMSAGVAPEVNLRNSIQASKHASEKSTLGLKPRADVTKNPKQGYQWPYEKDLCPPKFFSKSATLPQNGTSATLPPPFPPARK